jgi:hypothetical protein
VLAPGQAIVQTSTMVLIQVSEQPTQNENGAYKLLACYVAG